MRQPIILSGHETPDTLDPIEQAVIDQCRGRGLDCLLIPDVCHIAESSDLWSSLADQLKNAVLLCWIHPRPAEWLLHRHQIQSQGLTILNLASFADAPSVVRAIIGSKGPAKRKQQPGKLERLGEPVAQSRWFPVLDASRCVNCQHCLQFCLFGVYELDAAGRVAVCHPDQCKPGCPACSRICPQSAIMFPLYEKDAAIAGAPGKLVELDAAARKMFYTRTGRPCPTCGQTPSSKPSRSKTAKASLCPECGRPQSAGVSPAMQKPGATPAPLPFDDLDDLVNRLDQQMQRRR